MADLAVWKLDFSQDDPLIPLQLTLPPMTLDGVSERIPGGAYTTFRTFQGSRVLHLTDHLTRLDQTAQLAGFTVNLPYQHLREALCRAVALYPSDEKRVRLTLDLEETPGTIYISIESLHIPSEQQYLAGVAVVIRKLKRINPKAKLTGFIATASEIRHQLQKGVNEALMVDETGHILEGLSSNFFAVLNGEIWTAQEGVLSGITRSIVIDEIQAEGIPLHLQPILQAELAGMDEAFITSSSRAVLPVVQIDNRPIGTGKPGSLTRLLLMRYNRRIASELEEI